MCCSTYPLRQLFYDFFGFPDDSLDQFRDTCACIGHRNAQRVGAVWPHAPLDYRVFDSDPLGQKGAYHGARLPARSSRIDILRELEGAVWDGMLIIYQNGRGIDTLNQLGKTLYCLLASIWGFLPFSVFLKPFSTNLGHAPEP